MLWLSITVVCRAGSTHYGMRHSHKLFSNLSVVSRVTVHFHLFAHRLDACLSVVMVVKMTRTMFGYFDVVDVHRH